MMSWQLRQVLERVAHRVREVRLWSSLALCWLAWACVGALLVVAGVRSVLILAGFAALALGTGLACVVFALRSARDLRGVARRIEAAHPDLDAVLLTAVEETPRGPLQRMGFLQETVVSRALDHHRAHDWSGVVTEKAIHGARLAHVLTLCGLAAVLVVLATRAGSDAGSGGTGLARDGGPKFRGRGHARRHRAGEGNLAAGRRSLPRRGPPRGEARCCRQRLDTRPRTR